MTDTPAAQAAQTDFLIVGSGIAGLRAAVGLAAAGRVQILTKADQDESNTGYAQGGIAAAIGADDSPSLHAADTIRAGDGLCDEEAVRVLVEEGMVYVRELLEWGARFDRDAQGRVALGREAAHSVRRVLHAGDATGREIGRVLWERVCALAPVTTSHHVLVTEVVVEDGRVRGVRFFDQSGLQHEVRAHATLLATGGAGQVFRETTNPPVATGDGIALGFQAGARLVDLEFVQFHPTALSWAGTPRFLISEALRGEGARLVDDRGEAFMSRYHSDGDLAPRDVVARSIVREIEQTGRPVFLSLAHLDAGYVHHRFSTIAEVCRRIGLDLARDLIPVGPAAHYIMGGVDTDEWGRTSLPSLFAAGEVACTGVHGANRLASNSLLEGLVFGARAAIAMQEPLAAAALKPDRKRGTEVGSERMARITSGSKMRERSGEDDSRRPFIRDLLWRSAGLFRTREGLQNAVAHLDEGYAAARSLMLSAAPPDADAWCRFNLLTVARLIARAALRREESRGAHFRTDFSERDDLHWRIHLTDQLGAYGQ